VYSDKLNGNGKREIQLRAKPIINVSKLKINNIEYDTSTLHISNEFISSQECIFLEGYRNIQVIYQAGYDIEDVYNIIDGETSVDSEKEKIIDGNGNEHTIDGGDAGQRNEAVPELIKSTILRIATLLNTESDGNIGINGSSFGESGSRTYVSYTNFDKYLYPISKYKIIRI
jgi:hypothetical protein